VEHVVRDGSPLGFSPLPGEMKSSGRTHHKDKTLKQNESLTTPLSNFNIAFQRAANSHEVEPIFTHSRHTPDFSG